MSPDILTAVAVGGGVLLLFLAGIEATARLARRRWRDSSTLNARLKETVGELREALAQRRAMERQLREGYKMAAMGALAGGLSHELNNVLQPIVTFAQLGLDRDDLPAEQEAMLREMLKAAEQGAKIVDRTLAFAPGGAGETQAIHLPRTLPRIVALARESLAPGIEVETRIAADAGAVRVNRAEFGEVLALLLDNAAEAMRHEGAITVGLDACALAPAAAREQGLPPGDYLRLTVADQGPGIAAGAKEHIFQPFYTTKRTLPGDGTGLGLAVVYSLARGWNGNVTVASPIDGDDSGAAAGPGAEFAILIPVAEED